VLIIDAHLDLAWNALQWNRNLLQPATAIRESEAGQTGAGRGRNTVSLPDMQAGRVALCFATLLARSTGLPKPGLDYASPEQAYAAARGQLAYYRALETHGHARLITAGHELPAHWAEWTGWESRPQGSPPPPGLILSMESADPILSPDELGDWYAAGVRIIGPAHYGAGRYAGGTGCDLPLTAAGLELLRGMEQMGILLDLTHLSDAAFWQALEHFGGGVLASHNNCRARVPRPRQFSDDQIRAIITRGGVIGAALDSWMLQTDWEQGQTNVNRATLADVVDHMDHICQLAGNARHAAIGSDLDGGFGTEQSPLDLDTSADLQKIPALLAARGYSPADISGIMHGNWLRLLREAWGGG
jgi:membrane dipeptidase